MKKTLSRRAILRGAGVAGAGLALPFLPSWRGESGHGVLSRATASDGAPKRIVIWFAPWGTLPQYWNPIDHGDGSYTFNEILRPLEEFRSRTTMLSGVNFASVVHQLGRNGNHSIGAANILGAAGQQSIYPWGPDAEFITPRGETIDQRIARELNAGTAFPSLLVGDGSEHLDRFSQRHDGSEPSTIRWPHDLYSLAFGDAHLDADERNRSRTARRRMLDAVMPSYEHLKARVSSDDRRVLDDHFSQLSDLQRRIASATVCVAPPAPPEARWSGDHLVYDDPRGPYEPLLDLAARALVCDLTRVLTVRFDASRAQVPAMVPEIASLNPSNRDGDPHSYSHAHWREPGNTEVWKRIQIWRMERFAAFLRQLDAARDVDGRSVLDNTLVVHVSEILTGLHDTIPLQEWGYSNRMDDAPVHPTGMPFFYIGDAGGLLTTGRHVRLDGTHTYYDGLGKYSHGELWLTIARAMGIGSDRLAQFGTPELCNRLVEELIAGELPA